MWGEKPFDKKLDRHIIKTVKLNCCDKKGTECKYNYLTPALMDIDGIMNSAKEQDVFSQKLCQEVNICLQMDLSAR